ncbi:hypothetical protein Mapa_017476 [Marchantia paleacea]|nr:hypothetical protein Mapa_017476 [Marchantia paleacea]
MGSKLESDTAPLAINAIKSDDPAVQTMKDGEVQSKGWILRFSQYWNVFEMHPDSQDPRPWRFILGSLLTVIYIIGAVILFTIYVLEAKKDGRPTIIRNKFVDSTEWSDTDGYICSCDFPAEIQSAIKSDERNKTFNRCYNPEESRKELNVMQYASRHNPRVSAITAQLTNKKSEDRGFQYGHRLIWESYELKALAISDPFNTSFGAPLAHLSAKLDSMGYVGQVGYLTLQSLSELAFFTVPQGFIRATVEYNCKNCSSCEKLWERYNSENAMNNDHNDAWVFCDEDPHSSRVVGQVEGCSGFCRFFRTHDRPWGEELSRMANDLLLYVHNTTNGGETRVYFQPRLLYTNISTIHNNENYTLYFLEVDREETAWVKLLEYFVEIPECGSDDSQVLICTGASICEFAPTYSFQSVNSEELHVQCENYATGIDFQIDRQKCETIVNEPELRFTTDMKNTSVSNILCEDFQCQRVLATQIVYKNSWVRGEVALNHLVYRPAVFTSYVPEVCTNTYPDVLVVYEDEGNGKEVEKRLLSIHELNCTSGSSTGCWLTGRFKNMTDTLNENWKQHVFSPEEMKSGETMFACYKFDETSKRRWLWDFFGNVSGIIGSWLLTLSCIYWAASRPASRSLASYQQGSSPSHPDAPRPPPSVSLKTFEGYNLGSTWQTSLDIQSR